MHGTEKKPENNKTNHRSVHNENSDNPSRSAIKPKMAHNVFLDEPVHDPKTHLRPITETNKRDQSSVNKEKSVTPSRSTPAETMMQNAYPDGPECDVHRLQQPMTDARGLELVTKPIKVEQLQTPQDLVLHDLDGLVEQPENAGQKETTFTSLKEKSGVVVTTKDNSDVTTDQMNITKHYLESSTQDEEPSDYRTSLNNVSEVEFKALQIIENEFKKEEGVHISWDADSLVICGSLTSSLYVKKHLTSILEALRKKQSTEVSLDEEEKKIVQAVIGEVQSKDIICIYDEKMNQVVVYSDKQDDIRKFKHKLKIQTGKVKESGRSKQRFEKNYPSLEECQENFDSLQKSKDIQQKLSSSKNASDVEVFYTKENIKVAIYVANILRLPVDCIVNAANDSLSHGGGVAKVIADAAGSELILQGNATIMKSRNGKIPVGCQVTTSAGRLPYRCVIHTVGPCWADYEPHNLQKVKDCEEDLYRAIFGCFHEAEKYGLSSIALPAVSSGIYAVPQEMCAVQYAKAVLDYSRDSTQGLVLKEIHFIDKLPHVVKLIQDTFRTMIQNGKVPNYNIQNYVASSSHYKLKQSKDTGWKEHGKEDIPADNSQYETAKLKESSPFHYESKVHHTKQFVFQLSTKPVVCIYKGDILKVKNMDAVVCPDDAKGSGIGRIAIDLGTKAKYRQQKEKRFERQKPDLGDVVITDGEENSFNMIVYVVIENNFPQKPDFRSTMKKSIDNILRKTNEHKNVKTIAFPLFGVKPGILTEKSWAELFLERFVTFCHEVKNPNLEEVHIITHFASKTAYSTVKNVFIAFTDKVNKTQLQEKEPPPKLLSKTCDHKKDTQSGRGHDSKKGGNDIDDSCPICMCPKTDPKALSCGHSFCSECIDEMFKHKPVCPICGRIVGILTGDQPKDGTMDMKTSRINLAGYEKYGSIVITYDFPAGKQGPSHPSPGVPYGHMTRTAYLPNTPEGKKVCAMLKLAFERGLVFTISQSRTTGKEGLTWNDIHHKTNPNPGAQFGYPDPEYLTRVKDELAAKGITEDDLPSK
ncbi:hypothetical protein CHS0354_016678 [Potamilus streckersoni]|uniref:RING-type E3 ubiquitin transferase n=1 Tax=Potamilus streckersoni TaxID=2493646 RepID=A0AAE0TIB9_9BIVA|nr:hypothetical protein CHS0354_016678 [Potamilus streckersoni]